MALSDAAMRMREMGLKGPVAGANFAGQTNPPATGFGAATPTPATPAAPAMQPAQPVKAAMPQQQFGNIRGATPQQTAPAELQARQMMARAQAQRAAMAGAPGGIRAPLPMIGAPGPMGAPQLRGAPGPAPVPNAANFPGAGPMARLPSAPPVGGGMFNAVAPGVNPYTKGAPPVPGAGLPKPPGGALGWAPPGSGGTVGGLTGLPAAPAAPPASRADTLRNASQAEETRDRQIAAAAQAPADKQEADAYAAQKARQKAQLASEKTRTSAQTAAGNKRAAATKAAQAKFQAADTAAEKKSQAALKKAAGPQKAKTPEGVNLIKPATATSTNKSKNKNRWGTIQGRPGSYSGSGRRGVWGGRNAR